MTDDRLVTLGSYARLDDARRVRKKLEAAGIPAYIRGEAAALVAAGPVPLAVEVHAGDLEHARLVLDPAAGPDAPGPPGREEPDDPEDAGPARPASPPALAPVPAGRRRTKAVPPPAASRMRLPPSSSAILRAR